MPRLFDEVVRTHMGPALGAESQFHFYNRSALPTVDRLRKMLQRWVCRLPEEKQKDIVNRMRHKGIGSSANDRSFDSAFFELALHEFLCGTGGRVEVDPVVRGRTPDFSVVETTVVGETLQYYVEALDINITGNAKLEITRNERSCEDVLNEIHSPDFYLHVETNGVLESMPRKADLKAPFERLLGAVDYDTVSGQYSNSFDWDALPSATFTHGEWKLMGRLLPVSPAHWPKEVGSRFIALRRGPSGRIDDIGQVRNRSLVTADGVTIFRFSNDNSGLQSSATGVESRVGVGGRQWKWR